MLTMAATSQAKILAELTAAVANILGTRLGTVPGRPRFGFDMLAVVDAPVHLVPAIFRREATRALVVNEPRIVVLGTEVLQGAAPGSVRGVVTWRPATSSERAQAEVELA